jgi:hypothetical protein
MFIQLHHFRIKMEANLSLVIMTKELDYWTLNYMS